MHHSVFLPFLDRSITEVVEEKFQQLRRGKGTEEVAKEISCAINVLAKLRDAPDESLENEGDLMRPNRVGATKIYYTKAREILTRATRFMGEYDFTLNPYSGCSFGCTYCYAAFFSRDLAKRDDWGNWLFVKENAIELLQKRKPGSLDGKSIYMSSVSPTPTSRWSGN